MLKLAYEYEHEINKLLTNAWYDEKFMYYYSSPHRSFYSNPNENTGDWQDRRFVSLDSNGNIIGLITYGINRAHDYVNDFGAINFSDNKIVFGIDLYHVIDDIFCKFNMRRMEFFVVVGNPVEKSYDRLAKKYGGRIIGIRKKAVKLFDNQYYDDKIYEILREDYINAKERLNHGK